MITASNNVPASVIATANNIVAQGFEGNVVAVGFRHRLVRTSRNNYRLMSHEEFNLRRGN